MKVKQFCIHEGPICKAGSGSVFTERSIVIEPHLPGKMAVRTQDQKLLLHQILPAVRKMVYQNERKNGKGLQDVMSSMRRRCFFS